MLNSLFSLFYVTRELHRFLHRGRAKFCCMLKPLYLNFTDHFESFSFFIVIILLPNLKGIVVRNTQGSIKIITVANEFIFKGLLLLISVLYWFLLNLFVSYS